MLLDRFASTVVVLASVLAGSPCVAAADPPVFVVRGESERGPRISYTVDGPTGAEVARGRCRSACEVDPAWWAGPGLYVLHVDHDARSVAFELLGNEPALLGSLARDPWAGDPRVTITRVDERLHARVIDGGFEIENASDWPLVARVWLRGAEWVVGDLVGVVDVVAVSPPAMCVGPITRWPSLPPHETTELPRESRARRAWRSATDVVLFSAMRHDGLAPGRHVGWIPLWTAVPSSELEVVYLVPFGFTVPGG